MRFRAPTVNGATHSTYSIRSIERIGRGNAGRVQMHKRDSGGYKEGMAEPDEEAAFLMPTYTADEARRIVAGLATGKPARPRRPMSDAEWHTRYDPPAAEHRALMDMLRELNDTLQARQRDRRA